jgi:UDP-N-acetylmuramoyl-tripeptide--D-alanyl-D-alanine ligase
MNIEALYTIFKASTGISTDTRKIAAGNIFFALKGPNFNGNLFAAQAFQMGAAYCIVDELAGVVNYNCIEVEDVLATLQLLATYHRVQLNIPVLAIGGSNGKTTTKELCAAVLSTQHKIFFTQGNLNNHIGVPLSLLSIQNGIQVAVLELGANHIGETALLCDIAQPDLGLITNNGKDHLEGYGSLEGVRKGNGELYEHLKRVGGTVFVSTLQEDLMSMSSSLKRITYGSRKADISGDIISSSPFLKIKFESENKVFKEVTTNLVGEYNFENIMAAIAIGKYFKIRDENIIKALSNYKPSNNRSQWITKNGNGFIVDCYNANPSSMELAINNFSKMEGKKMLIAGDMFELGDYSDAEHKNILQLITSKKIDSLVLVGKDFIKANEAIPSTKNIFKNVEELKDWFSKQNISGYTILLKGSRGMKLEKLIEN